MKNRIIFVLSVVLILVMSISAGAVSVPDVSLDASVSVEMTYMGEAVAGGSLTAYRVAEIKVENGADYSFEYTEAYASCAADITDLENAGLAAELARFTRENDVAGTTLMIGEDGKVIFDELPLGIYLFVQNEAAKGYTKVGEFIASVPQKSDGGYVYDIDATPKISTQLETVETEAETEEKTEQTTPSDEKLPQTGMLKWPVPLLTITGAMFVVFGAYLVSDSKRKNNES